MYLPAPVRNDKRILKFPILSARKPAEKIIYFVLTENERIINKMKLLSLSRNLNPILPIILEN